MQKIIAFLKDTHKNIDTTLEIPPFISISLLILYTLISGVSGHLIGLDLFNREYQPFTLVFDTFLLRIFILILYIIFSIVFLYLMILWFRRERVRIPVLLSYYAIVTTAVFFVSLILFAAVVGLHYGFGLMNYPILIVFGVTIVIIFTTLNIYPGYIFFLAIRHRPIDIFWPVILYIIGIHMITYLMFRLWSVVDILKMWTG